MNNPYEVLEISENATDEQVKTAYLNMQKKYHPDNYEEGSLKQLAKEKTEEVTQAFDTIMNERRQRQAQSGQVPPPAVTVQTDGTQSGYTGSYQQSSGFGDIRTMIQQNRLVEAEELLDGAPDSARSAEWYFLKGTIYFSRGWMDEAGNFLNTAVQMDPANNEYRSALNRVAWQRQGNYGNQQNNGGQPYRQPAGPNTGCSACDVCCGMLCADSCCECMGGDCIPCC